MIPRSILYHDIYEVSPEESGFPGAAAAKYKLQSGQFARHLAEIGLRAPGRAMSVETASAQAIERPFFFTVDDGGVSNLEIADALEKKGWRGCFFVTTDRIDSPCFLSRQTLRVLAERGHTIGSHSATHPARISSLSDTDLLAEWSNSIAVLEAILGKAVRSGSVPGGYYTRRVGAAAESAGLEVLFTSEPTDATHRIGKCLVLGRYTVVQGMSPRHAGDLAAGTMRACMTQSLAWNAKKVLKVGAAPIWEGVRRLVYR